MDLLYGFPDIDKPLDDDECRRLETLHYCFDRATVDRASNVDKRGARDNREGRAERALAVYRSKGRLLVLRGMQGLASERAPPAEQAPHQ